MNNCPLAFRAFFYWTIRTAPAFITKDAYRRKEDAVDDIYARITTVLSERFGVEPSEISPELTMADLELDSLAAVEVADVLQEVLGVPIDDSAISRRTLGEISEILAVYGSTGS